MNNLLRWQQNYNDLKTYVSITGHFPSKHTKLNNWCRYQRKRIKAGTILLEQKLLFENLSSNRFDNKQ